MRRFPFAAGTVTALHGVERLQQTGPGAYRTVFPTDVAARQHVNKDQAFRFVLGPGRYVVTGTYDGYGRIPQMSFDVTVPPIGATLHENLRSFCK